MKTFVIPHGQQALLDCLAQLDPNKRYTVTVDHYKKARSLGSNNYYWGFVVTPMSEHCGYSPDEMHEELLGSFFGWKEKSFVGNTRRYPKRSTTRDENGEKKLISGELMQAYIHHCEALAARMGVTLDRSQREAA